MTYFPTPRNAGHWWLMFRTGRGGRLHAVPRDSLSWASHSRYMAQDLPIVRKTVCGYMANLSAPGPFSRIVLPRCAFCCAALDIPRGDGAPAVEAQRAHVTPQAREGVA